MSKFTLHTAPVNKGSFNCQPAMSVELDAEKILCNDIHLPNSRFNPHNVRLWVIGAEFGALGAVWANCEQDALHTLIDENLGDSLLVDEDELQKLRDIIANIDGNNSATQMEEAQNELDDYANLGNAGEECDLTNVWVSPVAFEPVRDLNLLLALAEAKGACADNLDQI